jgi:hypothetical protein
MRFIAAGLMLAVLAGAAAGDAEDRYPIKLHRAEKLGNVYEIHFTYDMMATYTAASPTQDAVTKNVPKRVDLTGKLEMQGVDGKGNPAVLKLTVKRMTRGDGRDMIRPGSVIKLARGVKLEVISCNTGPVPDAAMEMIGRFIPAYGTSGKTADDEFGSETPRKVGESWEMNRDATAQELFGDGIDVDPAQLRGKTTLNGVGDEGLRVTTTVTIPNMTLPIVLPAGSKLDLCSATVRNEMIVPLNPKEPINDSKVTVDSQASGHGKDSLIGLDVKAHEVFVFHSTLLPSEDFKAATAAGGT